MTRRRASVRILECLAEVVQTGAVEDPGDVGDFARRHDVDPDLIRMLCGYVPGAEHRCVRAGSSRARGDDLRTRAVRKYLAALRERAVG